MSGSGIGIGARARTGLERQATTVAESNRLIHDIAVLLVRPMRGRCGPTGGPYTRVLAGRCGLHAMFVPRWQLPGVADTCAVVIARTA